MATLRDSFLPVVDALRALPNTFGVRRFAVTIVRRVWSGSLPGEGTATDYVIALTPPPKVRDMTAQSRTLTPTEAELHAANSGNVTGNVYLVEKITPRYTSGNTVGGYIAEQIRLWPNRDQGAVENLVSLVGDDGYLRECVQISFEQDRAFGYSMLVKESDRPRTSLQSVSVTPATPTVAHGNTQQMIATGSFSGGSTSVLTTLSTWTSSNALVATVDIYGNVTAVASGTATITANVNGISGTATVTVT